MSAELSTLWAPNISPLASLCIVSHGREEWIGYLHSEGEAVGTMRSGRKITFSPLLRKTLLSLQIKVFYSPRVLCFLRGFPWGLSSYLPMDSPASTTLDELSLPLMTQYLSTQIPRESSLVCLPQGELCAAPVPNPSLCFPTGSEGPRGAWPRE